MTLLKGKVTRILVAIATLAIGAGICTFCFTILIPGFIESIVWPTPPDSTQTPPIYPNAQQIKMEDVDADESWKSKEIILQTSDEPYSVYAFYKDALLKDGWVEDYDSRYQPDPSNANFEFYRGINGPIIWAALRVVSKVNDAKMTEVTLHFDYRTP